MSHVNERVLYHLASLQALLAAVLHLIPAIDQHVACAVWCDGRVARRMTFGAYRKNGNARPQGLGFAVLQGRGGGGCREGPAYASAFSSFSRAVIHMASARSNASRSSAYFFCQMCSSSLRSS